jgi:hypothetical protein
MAKPFTVERMWPGQTVVILAGGPSVTPAQVRAIARARLLQKCRVIAVNDAVYLAWWADWLHACDAKWWHWHIQAVQRFAGIKTTTCEDVMPGWVDGYLKVTGTEGFDEDPSLIRSGGNGAYQAMHCAIHAGASKIILVGVDMRCGEAGESHWFGDHPDRMVPDHAKGMLPHFATLQPTLEARKITVLNASIRSALRIFPFCIIESELRV